MTANWQHHGLKIQWSTQKKNKKNDNNTMNTCKYNNGNKSNSVDPILEKELFNEKSIIFCGKLMMVLTTVTLKYRNRATWRATHLISIKMRIVCWIKTSPNVTNMFPIIHVDNVNFINCFKARWLYPSILMKQNRTNCFNFSFSSERDILAVSIQFQDEIIFDCMNSIRFRKVL